MANDDRSTKEHSQTTPPPMDPFPTYQTPYERSRHQHDKENPFIQFRRFADEQVTSLFTNIHNLFGLPPLASGKEPQHWTQKHEDMLRQRQEWEEGFRKQMEQEMEEMRQALEKSKSVAWKGMEEAWRRNEGEQSRVKEAQEPETRQPWWTRGDAAKCPALNGKQQSTTANKCPALYDDQGQPRTELDMYNTLHSNTDRQVQVFQAAQDTEKSPSPAWWSGMGWDGKQRQRHSEPASPSTTIYSPWNIRHMSPFDNPSHTVPWLLLSSYSPIYLCNPTQPRFVRLRIQDNEDVPFQIWLPRFARRRRYTALDEKRATCKPWADAFEDLLSLQLTGEMVSRDGWNTWRTPKTWIHDMVSRGSLGPTWGFNDAGLLMRRAAAPKAIALPTTTQDEHTSIWHNTSRSNQDEQQSDQSQFQLSVESYPPNGGQLILARTPISSSGEPYRQSQHVHIVTKGLPSGATDSTCTITTGFSDGTAKTYKTVSIYPDTSPSAGVKDGQTTEELRMTKNFFVAPGSSLHEELAKRFESDGQRLDEARIRLDHDPVNKGLIHRVIGKGPGSHEQAVQKSTRQQQLVSKDGDDPLSTLLRSMLDIGTPKNTTPTETRTSEVHDQTATSPHGIPPATTSGQEKDPLTLALLDLERKWQPALQAYKEQLDLLEAQNRRQAQQSMDTQTHPQPSQDQDLEMTPLQAYEQQVARLEAVNAKRLHRATETSIPPSQYLQPMPPQTDNNHQDYKDQVAFIEAQNKKKLQTARETGVATLSVPSEEMTVISTQSPQGDKYQFALMEAGFEKSENRMSKEELEKTASKYDMAPQRLATLLNEAELLPTGEKRAAEHSTLQDNDRRQDVAEIDRSALTRRTMGYTMSEPEPESESTAEQRAAADIVKSIEQARQDQHRDGLERSVGEAPSEAQTRKRRFGSGWFWSS